MNTEDVVRTAVHEHAGANPPPVDVAGPAPMPGPSEVYVHADGRVVIDGVEADARQRRNLHIARDGVAYNDRGGVPHLLTTEGVDIALAPTQPRSRRRRLRGLGRRRPDPTRPLVAWTEVSPDGSDVVLYDTAARQEVLAGRCRAGRTGSVTSARTPTS